jgi:hypothetical protein
MVMLGAGATSARCCPVGKWSTRKMGRHRGAVLEVAESGLAGQPAGYSVKRIGHPLMGRLFIYGARALGDHAMQRQWG